MKEGKDATEAGADSRGVNDRRDFLQSCGRFAAVVPAALTILLTTGVTSKAIAKSGGRADGPGKRWGVKYGPGRGKGPKPARGKRP